jgi:formylglycine-generating enzyme required for sulfatase activity
MHGNVYEWCQDRYRKYPSGVVIDPGPSSGWDGSNVRGGSLYSDAEHCRSANRGALVNRKIYLGFRLVRRAGGQD